ncbi:recombinase family protein [Ralstonia pseudosolanacearum]|uniref:recombinase family protein n=1 Tax=Ralstonia pseudosolanacearum TaxID=1310165 RepID=UPI0004912A84|nr:recombinase family protein [Ralstonia pseudosolanacearum]MDO3558286.1 recombinase family protein [Ralstonia pseudosolanacearum]MDO3575521.1 recombinase family protein [Ralstonia pseudosolanacearum]MDO3586893.1 recombinase family protein [Ralstonia pseudosolanacearum]MDO3620233.1 recombinase family protein [Ralstonia pseudosolanacearum]
MSRVFIYARVSTTDQEPANQIREIEAAGFKVDRRRIIEEHISGSVAASERPGFAKLLDRLEEGDVLVVSRLDRLGRSSMDVRSTIEHLAELGVRVHCLALGGVDLTSPAGRMTMQVIAAVAEFERDLLIERTQAGISRAKASGKTFGRPPALTPEQQQQATQRIAAGDAIAAIARDFSTTRQTIMRLRAKQEGRQI